MQSPRLGRCRDDPRRPVEAPGPPQHQHRLCRRQRGPLRIHASGDRPRLPAAAPASRLVRAGGTLDAASINSHLRWAYCHGSSSCGIDLFMPRLQGGTTSQRSGAHTGTAHTSDTTCSLLAQLNQLDPSSSAHTADAAHILGSRFRCRPTSTATCLTLFATTPSPWPEPCHDRTSPCTARWPTADGAFVGCISWAAGRNRVRHGSAVRGEHGQRAPAGLPELTERPTSSMSPAHRTRGRNAGRRRPQGPANCPRRRAWRPVSRAGRMPR